MTRYGRRRTWRFSDASAMLRGPLSMRAGGRPIPKGAVSRLSTGNGAMPQKMTGGRVERGCASRNAAPRKSGSARMASAGRAARAAMSVSYWAVAGRAMTCSMSKAIALMPFNRARSGKLPIIDRSSKSASVGSGTYDAPVAWTLSAKRAPAMKRTSSPRLTKFSATVNNGVI